MDIQALKTELRFTLDKLEQQRKDVVRRLLKWYLIVAAIAVVLAAFITGGQLSGEWLLVVTLVFLGFFSAPVICPNCIATITGDYKKDFKKQLISLVVQHLDRHLSYQPKASFSLEEVEASHIPDFLCESFEDLYGEDYVEGVIDKTPIRFSEIWLGYETSQDKNGVSSMKGYINDNTTASGLFLMAEVEKKFSGFTVVLPFVSKASLQNDDWYWKKACWNVSNEDFELAPTKETVPVQMEDAEFHDYFVVYATGSITAHDVLSTSVMRRLLEYRKQLRTGFAVSFADSHLYMMFCTHGGFEAPLFRKPAEQLKTQIENYLQNIKIAVDIVKELN
jgi:hypothetical protein